MLEKTEGAIKKGQSRETGNIGYQKRTIQRNWQHRVSKKDNPEKLATYGTQDEEKQAKATAQYVLDTTLHKQTQIM
jgi:hypothetical protein